MESLGSFTTESRNPQSEHIDELSTLEMLTVINQEDATVATAVASQLPEIARSGLTADNSQHHVAPGASTPSGFEAAAPRPVVVASAPTKGGGPQ